MPIKIMSMTPAQIASICDHTFLNRSEAYKTIAKKGESPVRLRERAFNSFLEKTSELIQSGKNPYALCVRPEDVDSVQKYFENEAVKIASVVGFPDGSSYSTEFKIAETRLALEYGAKEIDTVLNYNNFKGSGVCGQLVSYEITEITELAHQENALVKLILETSELSREDIIRACELANETGVDFVKTSTGFSAYGAQVADLQIMRENFSGGIKISGGVTPENVHALLSAASGRTDGHIILDPTRIRIGESSLLEKL